jgi:8-oxo-dGTP diphosphatase
MEVAAGLVFREGTVLVARRPAGGHLGGLWEFPGGKREPGEGWHDCLTRELEEELGVEVEVGPEALDITHDYPDRSVHLRFFLCRWRKHEPRAIGCEAVAWTSMEGLARFQFPEADRQLIELLASNPAWWLGHF